MTRREIDCDVCGHTHPHQMLCAVARRMRDDKFLVNDRDRWRERAYTYAARTSFAWESESAQLNGFDKAVPANDIFNGIIEAWQAET